MSKKIALYGARIFDGHQFHENKALLIDDEHIQHIVSTDAMPEDFTRYELQGGLLAPGYIDLQTNGGGGILGNNKTTVEGIRIICQAHISLGTTAILPTYITDTEKQQIKAIKAGIAATREKIPGFLGIHLEGPHLAADKKGAHNSAWIRPMTSKDVEILCHSAQYMPNLMITLAPEVVTDEHIAQLAQHNICVSLGHSNTTAERAIQAFQAGAKTVTHLFNAMSGLLHREPGLVGATLNTDTIYAGLIADGYHVCPDAIKIALKAKKGKGKIFLISDSMSLLGTQETSFELNGRTVTRKNGQLTLQGGTLAGADLDLASAVRFMHNTIGLSLEESLRMASLYPAQCLGIEKQRGEFAPQSCADIIHLNDKLHVQNVWVSGKLAHAQDTKQSRRLTHDC